MALVRCGWPPLSFRPLTALSIVLSSITFGRGGASTVAIRYPISFFNQLDCAIVLAGHPGFNTSYQSTFDIALDVVLAPIVDVISLHSVRAPCPYSFLFLRVFDSSAFSLGFLLFLFPFLSLVSPNECCVLYYTHS